MDPTNKTEIKAGDRVRHIRQPYYEGIVKAVKAWSYVTLATVTWDGGRVEDTYVEDLRKIG